MLLNKNIKQGGGIGRRYKGIWNFALYRDRDSVVSIIQVRVLSLLLIGGLAEWFNAPVC